MTSLPLLQKGASGARLPYAFSAIRNQKSRFARSPEEIG
jgi:hypothetical protein